MKVKHFRDALDSTVVRSYIYIVCSGTAICTEQNLAVQSLAPRLHAAAPWPLAASSACCHSKPYLDESKLAPVKGLKHGGGKDDEDGQLFSNDTPALPPKPKHRELPSATDDEMVAARR